MEDKNFKISNIVTVSHLSEELNLPLIYDLLSIIYFDYKIGTKIPGMGRETVPFFGINNAIVGLRYGTNMRGIKRIKGHLLSIIGIDLQCCNKNINLKLSKQKIQLAGAKSEQMAIEATAIVMEHLKMMIHHFNNARSLSKEVQKITLEWLIKTITYSEDDRAVLKSFDQIADKFDELEGGDKDLAMWLSMYACEYQKDASLFIDKIFRVMDYVCGTEVPFKKIPEVISYKVCNGLYNFSLGKKISLIQASQGMIKEGYKVSYHNWSAGKKLKIAIYISSSSSKDDEKRIENKEEEVISPSSLEKEDTDDEGDEVDVSTSVDEIDDEVEDDAIFINQKIQAHRFTINQSGSIKQISPTPFAEAYEQYIIIKRDLLRIIDD